LDDEWDGDFVDEYGEDIEFGNQYESRHEEFADKRARQVKLKGKLNSRSQWSGLFIEDRK
tara:strand:- start:1170 stop:1349 length:180 start_codon:yes stop_codon:yes gene_type:complete